MQIRTLRNSLTTSLLIVLISLSGCSSKYPEPASQPNTDTTAIPKQLPNLFLRPLSLAEDNVVQSILRIYNDWKGVPYNYSGQSKSGIDCSGFSQVMYKRLFNYNLPRTVNAQMTVGKEVSLERLHPGDLVFFKTGSRTKHVGIYTHSGNFVHASTSYGVTQSSFSNSYWNKRYITARTLYTKAKRINKPQLSQHNPD